MARFTPNPRSTPDRTNQDTTRNNVRRDLDNGDTARSGSRFHYRDTSQRGSDGGTNRPKGNR